MEGVPHGCHKVVRECVNMLRPFSPRTTFLIAIDMLRVQEKRKASKNNKEVYQGTRWFLLRNPENVREEHKPALDQLLALNKRLFTSYILRDRFMEIFRGITAHSRLIRLTRWKEEARPARMGHISEFLKKIERWEQFIRNSLRYKHSNAFAEGLNDKVRDIQRMAY